MPIDATSTRPKIYALYAKQNTLSEFGGDMISELATLRWMSRVADVYYNNVLFAPTASLAGDPQKPISDPLASYDLVYVRGNTDVLEAAHAMGCPTLFFGPPNYQAVVARTCFAVHTQREAARVQAEALAYGAPPPCLLIEQPGRGDIGPRPGSPHTEAFRVRWGCGFQLGFFGRVDPASMPDTLMSVRDILRHQIHDLRIIFAGKVQWKFSLPDDVFHERNYLTATQMSYALSACDIAIGIEQPEAEWAGSNRVLDCIRTRTPLLTRPYAARVEQLGEAYPLFFDSASMLIEKVVRYRYDPDFRRDTLKYFDRLAPKYRVEEIEKRNADRLCAQFGWSRPPISR